MDAELIRTLTLCNVAFPIYRVRAEDDPELVDAGELLDGYVDFPGARIVIRAGQSPTQERDSIQHEAIHAWLHCSGIGAFLRRSLKQGLGRGESFVEFEELLVQLATPHLVGIL